MAAHITFYCIGPKDNCQVKFSKNSGGKRDIFDTIVQCALLPLSGKWSGFFVAAML